ncbi:MAG: pilus assembly protein [Acidimicrobiia bacterium]|nr:pilus assembly protein [Acidimicrobiia bacterium]
MRRTQPTDRRRDGGAAIVEFALVAPVLIMIMMGVVQLGLLLHQQQGIHAAAREGARQGSFPDTTESEIEASVATALANINLANTPVVTISPQNVSSIPCDATVNPRPENVTVNVQVAAVLDIPFVAGQTVNLTGEGTFRCEYLD